MEKAHTPQGLESQYAAKGYHDILEKLYKLHHTPFEKDGYPYYCRPNKTLGMPPDYIAASKPTELEAFDNKIMSEIFNAALSVSRQIKGLYDFIFESLEARQAIINRTYGTTNMPLTGEIVAPNGLRLRIVQSAQFSLNKQNYLTAATLIKEALAEVKDPFAATVLKMLDNKPSRNSLDALKVAIADLSVQIESGKIQLSTEGFTKLKTAEEIVLKENKRIKGKIIPYIYVTGIDNKPVRVLLNFNDFSLGKDLMQSATETQDKPEPTPEPDAAIEEADTTEAQGLEKPQE